VLVAVGCLISNNANASGCASTSDQSPAAPVALREFVDRLRAATQVRDAAYIRRASAADIRVDFGGAVGLKSLHLTDPGAVIWSRLKRALSLGCRSKPSILKPDVWECPGLPAPPPEMGSIEEMVYVAAENVPLRERPSKTAPLVARASCEFAVLEDFDRRGGKGTPLHLDWRSVRLGRNVAGYVESKYIWPLLGDRVVIERRSGRWVMTAIVAGD